MMNNQDSTLVADCPCKKQAATRDRYTSFIGLDCNGQAQRFIALLRRHIDDPDKTNAFWEQFKQKLNPVSGPKYDELYLIHASINVIREYLEQLDDQEALALLAQIEEECC